MNEITPYSDLCLTEADTVRLEYCAARAEAGHAAAKIAMMDVAEALHEARGVLADNVRFGEWRKRRLPWLSAEMASQYLNVWREYGKDYRLGQRNEFFKNISDSALRMLAQPSAAAVREQVEADVSAGAKVPVAEIERLKREAREAKEAADRAAADRDNLLAQVEQASAREREARDHLRLAKQNAEVEKQQAAEKAREAAQAEIRKAKADAQTARDRAAQAQAELDDAVRKARADAEAAAQQKADAAAQAALAAKQKEVADLERRAKAAKEDAERRHKAVKDLEAQEARYREMVARYASAEREAPEQIEAAEKLMAALQDAMLALHGFEHAPLPPARKRMEMTRQMCQQMAEGIDAFLSLYADQKPAVAAE